MSEQMPNIHEEQMLQNVDAARAATQASGQYEEWKHSDFTTTEQMRASNSGYVEGQGFKADSVEIKAQMENRGPNSHRIDANVYKETPDGGSVSYHAYDSKDPNSYTRQEYGGVVIQRRDSDNRLVSERNITNPDSVRKFIGKIASQVTERAEAKQDKAA